MFYEGFLDSITVDKVSARQNRHENRQLAQTNSHLDFVMSRFRDVPDLLDGFEHGRDQDSKWNTEVEVVITPIRTKPQAYSQPLTEAGCEFKYQHNHKRTIGLALATFTSSPSV